MTQGISDSYVRWRGIEATLQLAQSPNTKIVIIGSGKDGLPVILGNVDTPMQPNPARRRRRHRPLPDNSEAAKQRPTGREPAAPGKDAGQQSAEPVREGVADRRAARVIGQAAGRGHARPGERGHRRDDRRNAGGQARNPQAATPAKEPRTPGPGPSCRS